VLVNTGFALLARGVEHTVEHAIVLGAAREGAEAPSAGGRVSVVLFDAVGSAFGGSKALVSTFAEISGEVSLAVLVPDGHVSRGVLANVSRGRQLSSFGGRGEAGAGFEGRCAVLVNTGFALLARGVEHTVEHAIVLGAAREGAEAPSAGGRVSVVLCDAVRSAFRGSKALVSTFAEVSGEVSLAVLVPDGHVGRGVLADVSRGRQLSSFRCGFHVHTEKLLAVRVFRGHFNGGRGHRRWDQ